jgi:hypothetical protein
VLVYVSTDASYRDGWAGIAYESAHLGSHSELVKCKSSSEAELRGLLLGMRAAEQARLTNVVFRTDCESTAQPHRGDSAHLRPLRGQAAAYLARHSPGWCLKQISRRENILANGLARNTRRARDDVTVTVNTSVASALVERAGIPVTGDGRWRLSNGEHSASLSSALSAALLLLAGVCLTTAPPDRPRSDDAPIDLWPHR